jgi:putative acetyltransferase
LRLVFKMKIFQVQSAEEIEIVRVLFEEYAAALNISLCFQGFAQEVSGLPGKYAAPAGRLLLAIQDDKAAGCFALRPLENKACEMKRLYVRPQFRGQGLGRQLVQTVIDAARETGYECVRLDTIPGKMDQAVTLYKSIGFKEIEPYYENPVPGATYLEFLF